MAVSVPDPWDYPGSQSLKACKQHSLKSCISYLSSSAWSAMDRIATSSSLRVSLTTSLSGRSGIEIFHISSVWHSLCFDDVFHFLSQLWLVVFLYCICISGLPLLNAVVWILLCLTAGPLLPGLLCQLSNASLASSSNKENSVMKDISYTSPLTFPHCIALHRGVSIIQSMRDWTNQNLLNWPLCTI